MQVSKKFIKLGTGADDVNSRVLPAHFTPTNYSPTTVGGEATTFVSAHLKGIDSSLGTVTTLGDISNTDFSITNDQDTPADVTGLVFNNGVTRAANIIYSIVVDATDDLYEVGELRLIQKSSSWELARSFNGDDSQIEFSITNDGQVQYTSPDFAGFSSGKIIFRSLTVQV